MQGEREDREARERFTYHGGDLAAARLAFPDAPGPWIDLSTGINGRAYPVPPLEPTTWARLPEPARIAALESAAARAFGARAECVVAAPGTQALIQMLPRVVSAVRVGVMGFTYAEHERAWRAAGASVEAVERPAALARMDVAIVVNPNNPDGRLVPVRDLLATAPQAGVLIVDEAFADLMPDDASLAPRLPGRGAVVLRSFGKSYGLAGLRLGFAVASPDLAGRIRAALGPWAVSGPAIDIAARAYADRGWLQSEGRRLRVEAGRLDALLAEAGARRAGGTPLFCLVEVEDGAYWFASLARHGILVRPFAERRTWLRFGIPSEAWHWDRLARALATLREGPG